jgi:tetratricopeptide (TPR) repeat protein
VIPFLIAAALQAAGPAAPPADSEEGRYRACLAGIRDNAERAVQSANDWRAQGGGVLARQCLGIAYSKLERWPSAATAFEQGAADAEARQDPRVSDLWVQAGNAWLAAGDLPRARKALDAALANPQLRAELRGEAHLDRARVAVGEGNDAAARADLDKALELVPADPFAWYLSAALARRERNLPRAKDDIAKAVELGGDDASVLLEAGNIAGLAGEAEAARGFWTRAVRAAPDSPAGRSAAAALAANGDDEGAAAAAEPTPAPQPK